jgi:hypothetical protein
VSIKQSCNALDERLVKLAGQLTFVEQIDVNVVRFKTRLEQIAMDAPGRYCPTEGATGGRATSECSREARLPRSRPPPRSCAQ